MTSKGTFYVRTDGSFVAKDDEAYDVRWNKTERSFRGIVVHRFVKGGHEFWTGVIHTTPAGSDLHREDIWPQIEGPLDHLNRLAKRYGIPLLVGGDFYIPPEGIIDAAKHPQAVLKAHAEQILQVKHALRRQPAPGRPLPKPRRDHDADGRPGHRLSHHRRRQHHEPEGEGPAGEQGAAR